ncbi:MAG: hypothetical protein LUC91_05430 [Prevotella sp.]|nr:hypothetical protein [Prevotella sp.]
MKKLFTLVAVALMAVGANAQESWSVVDENGTLNAIYDEVFDASEMAVVSFSTANVTGTQTSGPVSGYTDGSDLPLQPTYDNGWQGLKTQDLSPDGSVAPFYYIQGKGNPVNLDLVDWEEIVTDGEGTGTYRANWDASYYSPDGTNGLPTNGTYITLTPSVAGTMTVAVWINKGNREVYVTKASDAVALSEAKGELSVAGYINGTTWNEDEDADCPAGFNGYLKYQESISTLDEDGNDTYIVGEGNQTAFVYITFAAEAGETYYIFNKSTQIGFSGYTFTADETGNSGESEGSGEVGESQEDTWSIVDENGTLNAIYDEVFDASEMAVVSFSTANVTGTQTSGPVSGYTDGSDLPLQPTYDNGWQGLKTQDLSPDGSVAPFYYIQGKGNPVNLDLVDWEEIVTDGEGTGTYRANWDASYYSPDGTNGLPTNGTYITLTPSVAGTMTVAVWINKGNREVYVTKASDAVALSEAKGELSVAGYINGTTWNEDEDADCPAGFNGYLKYQESISTLDEDGNDTYIVGEGNQTAFVYITFAAEAGETYYIFNKSTQIGFSGYTFTTGESGETEGISEIVAPVADPNAPIYNLAGQRVAKGTKGILIQNGKKFISK